MSLPWFAAGITCDGCGCGPIVGYRYRCRDCANHDVCENCYDSWAAGKVTNGLGKQVVSLKAEDHRFELHKDKQFSSLVKKADGGMEKAEKQPKLKLPHDSTLTTVHVATSYTVALWSKPPHAKRLPSVEKQPKFTQPSKGSTLTSFHVSTSYTVACL